MEDDWGIIAVDENGNEHIIVEYVNEVQHQPISGPSKSAAGSRYYETDAGIELNYEGKGKFVDFMDNRIFQVSDEEMIAWLDRR